MVVGFLFLFELSSSGLLELIVMTGVAVLFLFEVVCWFDLFLLEWGGGGRLGRLTFVGLDVIFLMARSIAS